MQKSHLKKLIINLLKLLFASALIYWLISSGRFDFQSLGQLLTFRYAITSLALVIVSIGCLSERWRLLLKTQGFSLTALETMKLTLIGIFFNYAMPGGVGGDLIKGYYVIRSQPHRKFDSAMTVLMDRVFGLYMIVAVAALSTALGFEQIWSSSGLHFLAPLIGLIFFAFTLFLALGFSNRIKNIAHKLLPNNSLSKRLFQVWDSLLLYKEKPMILLKIFTISLLAQTLFLFFYIQTGDALGFSSVSINTYLISSMVGTMITAIPISPAGVGVGQAAFAYLFAEVAGNQKMASLGASLATVGQIAQFIWGLLGALFYINMKSHQGLPKE